MNRVIQIVNRGRGLQLSTSRVTVQDLVPYFQEGCSYDEIIRWIPTLSQEEIAIVERYYLEHKQELDEEDRLVRERGEHARTQHGSRERWKMPTPSAWRLWTGFATSKATERPGEWHSCRHQHLRPC